MPRSLRHAGKVVAAAFALLLLFATTAQAEENDNGIGGGGGSQEEVDQVVTVTATTTFLPVGSDGSTGAGCTEESSTTVLIDDDFAIPISAASDLVDNVTFNFPSAQGHAPDTRLFSPTGRWFNYRCGNDIYLLPEGGPAITIGGLVDEVIRQLDPPDPTLAVTPDHGKHAVQMPSWLAVDPAYWNEPRTRTATSGRVAVTATLTPTQTSWDMGNGDTEDCDNPGVVWQNGMPESHSPCSYTYNWPSINPPNNTYELAGTVSFDVSHTTNAPGTYGPWVPVERTATETIQVVEIQAVASPNT